MPESQKATRATITIGPIQVDGFMLPDGSYRMSQTQAAEVVEKDPRRISDFLRSKAFKGLLGKVESTSDFSENYAPDPFIVDIEGGKLGQTRINGLRLEIVSLYWHWQSHRGNKKALSLCVALATETLERRFDAAFGVTRTEQERDDRLSQRLQQLEQDLKGAMDFEAAAQYELNYVRDWLKQKGLDPWELPGEG